MKERLTGAIILVALIVVLVPELLSGPIRPAARTHGPTPSAEEPPLRSYTIDLADDAHGGSGTLRPQSLSAPAPVAPAAAESTAAPPPAAVTPPEKSVAPATPAPPVQPAQTPLPAASSPPASPAPVAAASGTSTTGYMVQLGSFASRTNAEGLAQRVRALNFPVVVSRGTSGRHLYRVLVGPAHDRAAAEQILSKLRAHGQKGTVVPK